MTCHRVSAGWRLRPAPTPGAPWPALAWRFSPLRIITSPRATQKIMPAQQDAPIRDVKRLTDIQLPPPRLCCGSGHTLPLASRPARQRTPSGPGCSASARNEICGQARPCSGARNDRIIWQRLYRAAPTRYSGSRSVLTTQVASPPTSNDSPPAIPQLCQTERTQVSCQ